MKYDGHVKLTRRAIEKVKNNCPMVGGVCGAPMFKKVPRVWIENSKTSNATDNYSAGFVNSFGPFLNISGERINLPDAVAYVDIGERWTHDDPKGQRFHFMVAKGESESAAYQNAIKFIKTHTENWVNAAKDIILEKNKPKPLQNASGRENKDYVKELALALHSLQDSFSIAHTHRYYGDICLTTEAAKEAARGIYIPGTTDSASPIRRLFIYDDQDHDKHGEDDYSSGGVDTPWGSVAVNASVALITMGIVSIPSATRGLTGWDAFVRNWLSEKIDINRG